MAVGLGLSVPFVIVAFNLDMVAKGLRAIKLFVTPVVGRSLVLAGVGLAICGVMLIVIWTSHLATNIKTTVTIVVGLAALLGLFASGIQILTAALPLSMSLTANSRSVAKSTSSEALIID